MHQLWDCITAPSGLYRTALTGSGVSPEAANSTHQRRRDQHLHRFLVLKVYHQSRPPFVHLPRRPVPELFVQGHNLLRHRKILRRNVCRARGSRGEVACASVEERPDRGCGEGCTLRDQVFAYPLELPVDVLRRQLTHPINYQDLTVLASRAVSDGRTSAPRA